MSTVSPVHRPADLPYHRADSASAAGASSMDSNSQPGTPGMSPEEEVLTTGSSVQPSPELPRGREGEFCPSSFQLPDSIISRRTSSASLGPGLANGSNAGVETSYNQASASATASGTPPVTGGVGGSRNLIRRLSSRASRSLTSRRRQSSAAPTSRDGSVGPCFLRRRSDSNTTAPPDYAPISTDSEADVEERDDVRSLRSILGPDGGFRESSANSTTGSINGSSSAMAGPVLPLQLSRGTWLKKVSKKNRAKRLLLVYEPDWNRLCWDKAKSNKFLHVDEIREIRTGSDIQQYGRDFNIPEAERATWFSIIYYAPDKSKLKLMHLIADNSEACNSWVQFLEAMLIHRQEVMSSLMAFNDKAIASYWQNEMSKLFGTQQHSQEQEELDVAGVKRVCQNLHIYSSQSTLETNFRLSDVRQRDRLNFSEFMLFIRRMNSRLDIQRLMRDIAAKPSSGITLNEFLTFLRVVQKEDVDSNRAAWEKHFIKIVRKYRIDESDAPDQGELGKMTMSEAAFIGYLTSKQNALIVDEPQEYELDRPMNEYFISSSHNTYLIGRQVAGQSSIEGYISALVRGCRCVEVDCWDGPDGEPQVVHGRTLTSAISFRETMTTINKYAFVKSRWPLWISLEVHCNPAQQAIMAEVIKEAFGSRLVTEPLDPTSKKLPSPSQLMERVLIKVKKPRMTEETWTNERVGRRRGSSLSSPISKTPATETLALSPSQSLPQSPMLSPAHSSRLLVSKSRVNTIAEGQVPGLASCSTSDNDSGGEAYAVKRPSNKTVKVLGQLGVYCAGVKFFGFDDPEAKKFNHIFSFMESSFAKNSRTKEDKMALDIHNMRYLMRVYPDGKRISSSNFDPLIYWRRGVQMAAMNWQTFDMGLQLNQAMFEGGRDASGYVLKPPELRDIQVLPSNSAINSAIAEGKKERFVINFTIDVLSAQQLMRPANLATNKSMDPYVEVEVFHANDKRDKKEVGSYLIHEPDAPLKAQTEVIKGNGFNPIFKSAPMNFKVTTKHPDLVFVRWAVKLSQDGENHNTKDRPPIATYMAKLVNLKQGFRTIPLRNHAGDQYLFSTLFCKINIAPAEQTFVEARTEQLPEGGKLNRLGGRVFGRMNSSPRGTIEKGDNPKTEKSSSEKLSFESCE